MLLIGGNTKYTSKYGPGTTTTSTKGSSSYEDSSEYEYATSTALEEEEESDSGNEDEEEEEEEELNLPEDEDEDEEESEVWATDDEILARQMNYPPVPQYASPEVSKNKKNNEEPPPKVKKPEPRLHPRERLGMHTPIEEVTEPPSSAGSSSVSSSRKSRSLTKTAGESGKQRLEQINQASQDSPIKNSLKKGGSDGSPDRHVKFAGSPENKGQEEVVPETKASGDEQVSESPKSSPTKKPEVPEPEPEKVQEEPLGSGSGSDNNEEGTEEDENGGSGSTMMDNEFPSVLDDMIADLHSWDRLAGTGASLTEINASRQDHLAHISSQLSSQLSHVSPTVVVANLAQLIPLLTTLLSLTQVHFRSQLSTLNALNALSDKIKAARAATGLRVLPNCDLTWLLQILCDISSESSRSVLKSVATAALASLVKAAGPPMICDPIFLILRGSEDGRTARGGSGNIVLMSGVPGGAPKVKATAMDAVTFALLTFPRDEFDLDEVAKLGCHALLHPRRRVRQAALECLAVVAHAMGPSTAVPLFKKLISAEEAEALAASQPVVVEVEKPEPKPSKHPPVFDPGLTIDPDQVISPPSRIPVPIKNLPKSEETTLLQPPSSPAKGPPKALQGGPSPGTAVSARVSRHLLPSANLEELVEYGVKIPGSSPLLQRQSMKIGDQRETSDDISSITSSVASHFDRERFSSGESGSSVTNLNLELEPVLSSRGSGASSKGKKQQVMVMAADISWILAGAGPVKKCDPATMLPQELNALIPTSTKYVSSSKDGSGNESSDFSSVSNSKRNSHNNTNEPKKKKESNSTMRRANAAVNKAEVLHDSYFQEPYLGRYYYPPHNPSRPLPLSTGGADYISGRFARTYNLYPSSVLLKNDPHHHIVLPGSYEDYGDEEGNDWASDLGSLHQQSDESSSRPRPLAPLRKKSSDNVSHKPPMAPTKSKVDVVEKPRTLDTTDELSISRRQTESIILAGVNRDLHVYHSRIDLGTNNVPSSSPIPPPPVASSTTKRGDADSAGSSHTRDSGVSMGSLSNGTKSPPLVPPAQSPSPPPQEPRGRSTRDKGNLRRDWKSTADVPLEYTSTSTTDKTIYARGETTRDLSGSSSRSSGSGSQRQTTFAHSEDYMPVHSRPVLARRGVSMTRVPVSPPTPPLPPLKRGQMESSRSTGRNHHIGSGDYEPIRSPPPIRVSVSTGNLSRIPQKSSSYSMAKSYHEDDEEDEDNPPPSSRVSARRDGPFGDLRADPLPVQTRNKNPKGKIVPTKIYKGSFREVNSRKNSNGGGRSNEVFPLDLKPVTSAKHALPMALGQLDSSAWETNVEGFKQLVRIIRFDHDFIRPQVHEVNMAALRHLTNLRSQVCRSAILTFRELFIVLGRAMEPDAEKVAEKLFDKTADTNKFIREDAGRTLETLVMNLTPAKGLACLDLFGTRHRNPVVRTTAARLTARLVEEVGPERALVEMPERLLPMLCRFLQEGSLETRTHAKAAMSSLMLTSPGFESLLTRYVPGDVLRHAQKNIDSLFKSL